MKLTWPLKTDGQRQLPSFRFSECCYYEASLQTLPAYATEMRLEGTPFQNCKVKENPTAHLVHCLFGTGEVLAALAFVFLYVGLV